MQTSFKSRCNFVLVICYRLRHEQGLDVTFARRGSGRLSNKVPCTEFANITHVNNSSQLYHVILALSLSLFFIHFSTINLIVAFVLHTSPHLQFQCFLPVTNAIDFYARVYCSQSRPPPTPSSSISVTIFVNRGRGSTGCSIA